MELSTDKTAKHQCPILPESSSLEPLYDILKLVQHVVKRSPPVITDAGRPRGSDDPPSSVIDSMESVHG
jgi:hypothetical protein